jgi:hypothetical protein
MAVIFWPLRMQGADNEESGVRGGEGEEGCCCPPQRENWRGKNVAVYSLIVGLRGI